MDSHGGAYTLSIIVVVLFHELNTTLLIHGRERRYGPTARTPKSWKSSVFEAVNRPCLLTGYREVSGGDWLPAPRAFDNASPEVLSGDSGRDPVCHVSGSGAARWLRAPPCSLSLSHFLSPLPFLIYYHFYLSSVYLVTRLLASRFVFLVRIVERRGWKTVRKVKGRGT